VIAFCSRIPLSAKPLERATDVDAVAVGCRFGLSLWCLRN
jgi:hypothetical protein